MTAQRDGDKSKRSTVLKKKRTNESSQNKTDAATYVTNDQTNVVLVATLLSTTITAPDTYVDCSASTVTTDCSGGI